MKSLIFQKLHLKNQLDLNSLLSLVFSPIKILHAAAAGESKTECVTRNIDRKTCKFCSTSGHSMFACPKYNTHDSRVARCVQLKLCPRCSSSKHSESECAAQLNYKCNLCNSVQHISALCNLFKPKSQVVNRLVNSVSSFGGTFLLPVITIKIRRGKSVTRVNTLIDTGSMHSYISTGALRRINYPIGDEREKYLVNSSLGTAYHSFSEVCISLNLSDNCSDFQLPVMADDNFHLNFKIEFLDQALSNLQTKFNLADFEHEGDCVNLEGLLGVDVIQFFPKFEVIKCMNGSAFSYASGIIPFGNIDHFLSKDQLLRKYQNFEKDQKISESVINFVLNPPQSYFDPISAVSNNSMVEHKLDNLFNVESLGITEDSCVTDQTRITEFKEKINFCDGKYHVELPWIEEKINLVRPNFEISKAILKKVYTNLKINNCE